MRCILAALALGFSAVSAAAEPSGRASLSYDFAAGGNDGVRGYSASVARHHGLFLQDRVFLGYGARASLATGTLLLEPAKGDSSHRVTIDSARLAMFNAAVHAGIRLEPVEFGMNLDVAGVSVGASESASYRTHPTMAETRVGAAPTPGNLFLVAPNDRGSLNSEFYAAWRVTPALALRAGLSHLLTEYTIDQDLGAGTRRYRRFSNLFFLAVRWTPGR